MRTLTLINEYGVSYALSALPTGFIRESEGFGYNIDAKYIRIGDSFVNTFFETKQQKITGTIEFGGASPYEAFADFAKFVRTSHELTLCYATPAGTYYREVDVTELEKAEKTGATLPIEITMACRSLWFAGSETRFEVQTDVSDAMQYEYAYPYRYVNFTAGKITLTNDGSVPAPLTVRFEGPITNPSLTLTGQDSAEISRVDITGEAHVGGVIEYSSVDGSLLCQLDESGTQTNLAGALDISNENFFKVPVGTYVLEISADSAITAGVTVTMLKLYKAV